MSDSSSPRPDGRSSPPGSVLRAVAQRLGQGIGRRLRAARGDRPVPEGPVRLSFEGGAAGEVPGGSSILVGAQALDVDLSHYCGGMCSCGTCRVVVVSGAGNLSQPQPNETLVLGATRSRAGDRLACQARLLGPARVRIPERF